MGDVARMSLNNEDLLYRLFGVNAELLIDHAWGVEPCTMADIKAYSPKSSSLSSGQVLPRPYPFDQARLVVREMADALSLDLVEKGLLAQRMSLTVGYDTSSLSAGSDYAGEVTEDWYGRKAPKNAHGTADLERPTSSSKQIADAVCAVFDRVVDPSLAVRRMYVVADGTVPEDGEIYEQTDLFSEQGGDAGRERNMQQALLDIKKKFGKNAILKGMNLQEGSTARQRNSQVGGHKA